jgi:hemin uptake protein HemP
MQKAKPSPERTPSPHKVSSDALLGARRELVIIHNGRDYRLRVTQNGKLILTA